MPWVGFEPTISAGERPKTYALDRTATGTGIIVIIIIVNYSRLSVIWWQSRSKSISQQQISALYPSTL